MVVILLRDKIGAGFDLGRSVCHRNGSSGSLQHGNVVFGVSGSDTVGKRNLKMLADETDSVSLPGGLIENFKINRIGKNCGDLVAVFFLNSAAERFQTSVVFHIDRQKLAGCVSDRL